MLSRWPWGWQEERLVCSSRVPKHPRFRVEVAKRGLAGERHLEYPGGVPHLLARRDSGRDYQKTVGEPIVSNNFSTRCKQMSHALWEWHKRLHNLRSERG